jgi:hypothetical protein
MHYGGKQLILESSDRALLQGEVVKVLNDTVVEELKKLTRYFSEASVVNPRT